MPEHRALSPSPHSGVGGRDAPHYLESCCPHCASAGKDMRPANCSLVGPFSICPLQPPSLHRLLTVLLPSVFPSCWLTLLHALLPVLLHPTDPSTSHTSSFSSGGFLEPWTLSVCLAQCKSAREGAFFHSLNSIVRGNTCWPRLESATLKQRG